MKTLKQLKAEAQRMIDKHVSVRPWGAEIFNSSKGGKHLNHRKSKSKIKFEV